MQNENPSLGEYFEQARRSNGFSYRQLSVLTGIPRTTIIRLCHGTVRSPRPAHITALAQQMELPSAEALSIAGIDLPAADGTTAVTASLEAHLRAEYDLTEWEAREARQSVVRIIQKHRARQVRIHDQTNSPHPERRNHDQTNH